jgi:hypothetical protein
MLTAAMGAETDPVLGLLMDGDDTVGTKVQLSGDADGKKVT